jgi:hypothetical protein
MPVGDGDGFDDALFEEADRAEGFAVVVEKLEEFFGALGGECDGVGEDLAFFGVACGASFAFRRARTSGEGRISG